jgi:peptidoglycan/LPS O-acetylase OafA/YrhL
VRTGRPLVVTLIAFAVAVVVDVVVGYSPFPGYGALIGFLGCVVIVVVSRWLGRWLSRPEDYYADDVPIDLQEDLRG